MLPVTHGARYTQLQIVLYTVALFAVTLPVALCAAACATVIATLAAIALVRFRRGAQGLIDSIFMLPILVPSLLLGAALYLLFARFKLAGGYTLLIVSTAHVVDPWLYKEPYDPVKDFVPVSIIATGTNVLTVHPSVPVHSVKELLDLAKAKPGVLNYASAGIGSFQHLSAEHESLLPGLLGKKTKLPVQAATEGTTVQTNHVYVIPPNCTMTIDNGVLRLSERLAAPPMPIDTFFRSLAENSRNNAVGVILSGTATDGTNVPIEATDFTGLIRVAKKEEVGLTVVGPEEPLALGIVNG